MAITLEGAIYKIGQVEQITEKFSKRDLILTVDPASKYPAYIPISAPYNNFEMYDDLKIGESVVIHVNLNGRLHKDKNGVEKAYPSFSAWKIDKPSSGSPQAPKAPPSYSIDDIDGDNLPF